MATGGKTFDGASFQKQAGTRCIMFLQLRDLQTERTLLGKTKLLNADIPICEVTSEKVSIELTLHDNDHDTTYKWEKLHDGKIAKCKAEVEPSQLKVILTKSNDREWDPMFVDYLTDI